MFKTVPGTELEAYKAAASKAGKFLAKQPGFCARSLVHDESEDLWIDIVSWEDMQSAQTAAKSVLDAPECADFFRTIDLSSAKMIHAKHVPLDD